MTSNDSTASEDPEHRSIVLDRFLRRFFEDQDGEAVQPLEFYLSEFPGHEQLIARSYAALLDEGGESVAGLGPLDRLGPYRILRELGHGGQSSVYLAEDSRADRQVALKVLHPSLGKGSGASIQRLRREAEAAAQIQHPGICPIFEIEVEAQAPYLTMPYLDGHTLAHCIAHSLPPTHQLDATLETFASIGDALQAAHEARIVHRDVKPDNIIILADGRPVLLDLGVARTYESDLTRTGAVVGTLPYMAPEQLEGWKDIDGRIDVYGLGVSLFEALAGRLPFEEPTQQRLTRAILEEEAPDLRQFVSAAPSDLAIVLRTALAKDARHRYQSARALASDLRSVLEHRPIQARPATTTMRFGRWCRRNPALAFATSSAFVILTVGLAVTLFLLGRVQREESAKGQALAQRETALQEKDQALEAKREALEEFQQLADHRRLADLVRAETELWPVRAQRVPAMQDWLDLARSLLARVPAHRATLQQLEEMDRGGVVSEDRGDEVTLLWHAEALRDLLSQLETFEAKTAAVRDREARARTIESATVVEHKEAWQRTLNAVRTDPRYAGFVLEAEVGLVPLGFDPETGFPEFLHLESGRVPQRSADGQLVLQPESGLVFVLIPGGSFAMGADAPTRDAPIGRDNVDPYAGGMAAPVHEIEIEPFLLSKYELTQGQWLRMTGSNPSYFQGAILKAVTQRDLLLPVEHVSWLGCDKVFRQRGLGFPTEAQWEYACRAGTTSIWYSGDEQESLIDFENLSDQASAPYRRQGDPFIKGMDDGAVTSAFVGSYFPNPFGLHDMTGNVLEWCADYFGAYSLPVRPGDALRQVDPVPARALRGGCFRDVGGAGSSAARHNGPPEITNPVVGVRPVFRLSPRSGFER